MPCRIILTGCLTVGFLLPLQSQTEDLRASFAAIIVNEMDSSLQWYKEILKFQEVDRTENPDFGLVQVNLIRGEMRMELIEIQSAIDPYEIVGDTGKRKRFTGIFKVGFSVKNFDSWVEHLNSNELVVNDDIVSDPLTGGRMVVIRDPDGNRIQLFEEVE